MISLQQARALTSEEIKAAREGIAKAGKQETETASTDKRHRA